MRNASMNPAPIARTLCWIVASVLLFASVGEAATDLQVLAVDRVGVASGVSHPADILSVSLREDAQNPALRISFLSLGVNPRGLMPEGAKADLPNGVPLTVRVRTARADFTLLATTLTPSATHSRPARLLAATTTRMRSGCPGSRAVRDGR